MTRFPGIYVATVTPFNAENAVDYRGLQQHVEWLLGHGVHGIVASGSCAEYGALSDDERRNAVEAIAEVCKSRAALIVGTGASSTDKAVYWAKHAAKIGAAGIMALPPSAYRPSHRELIAWYGALDSAGLPIIAYNNPFDTTSDLVPELLVELAKLPNMVAVKEYSGDVRRVARILELTDLDVLVGCDDLALEGLLAGAIGWIAGLTNALPAESMELYRLAIARDVQPALALYRRLLPLFRYDSQPVFVQAIKEAMAAIDRPMGPTRGPRLPLEPHDAQLVAEAMRAFTSAAV